MLILIGFGLAIRIVYIAVRGTCFHEAEAGAVAVVFAQGKGLADAYFPGSGPTAHFLPTIPVIAGTILRMFGIGSMAARVTLFVFSRGQLVVSTLLAVSLFKRLGVGQPALLAAVACAMLLPVTFAIDTYSYRVWDNGLTYIVVLACLIDQVRRAQDGRHSFGAILQSAFILGVSVFVNPALGAALAIGTFIIYWRSAGLRSAVAVEVATLAVFIAAATSWIVRNERLLGAPIVSRSNAGLELAMANYEGALAASPGNASKEARQYAVHPFFDGPGRAAYRRYGEYDYYQALGRAAARWIVAHPIAFARLASTHMLRTLTPFGYEPGGAIGGTLKAVIVALASWLGPGALVALIGYDRGSCWWIIGLFVVAGLSAYAPFLPSERYIYPFYELLLLSAAGGIDWLFRRRKARRNVGFDVAAVAGAQGLNLPYVCAT